MSVKRCTKGKSCGATCIDARERCVLELGPEISSSTSKVKDLVSRTLGRSSGNSDRKSDAPDLAWESWNNQQLKNRIKWAENAGEKLRIVKELKRRGEGGYTGDIAANKVEGEKVIKATEFPKVTGIKGYDPIKAFDAPDSKTMGSGAMGEVKETNGHPPGVVKKGSIGRHEAEALKALEGTGLAPTLHGQRIVGVPRQVDEGLGQHVDEAKGYLGMSKSPGKPLASIGVTGMSPQEREEMADAFLSARATLHRKGVAHNDMHTNNYFYDQETKKGHLVDFGLAQVDKRAALMEALGLGFGGKGGVGSSFDPSLGYLEPGDYQAAGIKGKLGTAAIPSRNFDRYMENRKRVLAEMGQEHPAAAKAYRDGGIRMPTSDLDKAGLTEDQARTYIDKLYEGIN